MGKKTNYLIGGLMLASSLLPTASFAGNKGYNHIKEPTQITSELEEPEGQVVDLVKRFNQKGLESRITHDAQGREILEYTINGNEKTSTYTLRDLDDKPDFDEISVVSRLKSGDYLTRAVFNENNGEFKLVMIGLKGQEETPSLIIKERNGEYTFSSSSYNFSKEERSYLIASAENLRQALALRMFERNVEVPDYGFLEKNESSMEDAKELLFGK